MSDKHEAPQDAPTATFFALPGYRVVALEGADAASFAQAQFINDVKALQPGHWQWSGWLTPKGRVIALFALLKRDEETIWLLVADADAAGLVDALVRFRFRSRTTIRLRDELCVNGAFSVPDRAHGSQAAETPPAGAADGDRIELDLSGDGGPRCMRIASGPAAGDAAAAARWRLFDLEHGWPRLGPDQVEQWTPQQLSLERLRGFSVKKGCYPGQEIVARTHFLGKAKRGLVLLEAGDRLAPGTEVRAADKALGSVVSTADADGRHVALAVLPLDRDATAFEVGGATVREIPIREGLAR